MNVQEAYNYLDPKKWADTSISKRLKLLKETRSNMETYAVELAKCDADMKNNLMNEELYSVDTSMMATVIPVANTLSACIHLYESLEKGVMPKPEKITKISDDIYDVEVKPMDLKERLVAGSQKFHLRVKGTPTQTSPLDKPAGVIAVSGAGNYSSSLEMVKAMFLENKAVIHKPHRLNEATDKVWEKIFKPLVDYKAIIFVGADQGHEMPKLEGLDKIYFTGSTAVAKAIAAAASAPLISECGGNNPAIIVPGDRLWTAKELEHQAIQIATISKLNGGAVCGRIQTIVVAKDWSQRKEFMAALEKAIVEQTPANGTYYPGSDKTMAEFQKQYPHAKILQPENGKYKAGKFMVIEDVDKDSYATKNEAFCQIINEVPLDVEPTANSFLPIAVDYCNNNLLGTLGCCILIDENTKKVHQSTLDQAVNDLSYGGIAINTTPPLVFLSPYLTWGGNEEGKEFVSGHGNFGNAYSFDNIEKSIIEDNFISAGHMMNTNKRGFDHLCKNLSTFSMHPSWFNLTKMLGVTIIDGMRSKDF